jgi:hypothetical protein
MNPRSYSRPDASRLGGPVKPGHDKLRVISLATALGLPENAPMHLGHHALFHSCSALILMAAARAADAQNEYPPTEPESEIMEAEGGAFVDDCRARILAIAKNLGFELSGPPLLTRSERWGLIWRTDFAYASDNFAVNRFVCAERGANGPAIVVAIGQDLTPLTQGPVRGVLVH